MVMTKRERQHLEQLERRLRVMGALRWTWPVTKDVPVPRSGATSGWTFNSFTAKVQPAWSHPSSHGVGSPHRMPGVSGSQGGMGLYSSRLLALRALRYSVECAAAEQLADIDVMIEVEEKGSN